MKFLKLRLSKKLLRSNSSNKMGNGATGSNINGGDQIKWEVRPGGMLVQKRERESGSSDGGGEELITLRVSTFSKSHDISIQSTSTFGELKLIMSLETGMEAKEQRVLFKGKEREECEYLHMVGVRDNDKVLVLEDPAVKERKLTVAAGVGPQVIAASPYRTINGLVIH